MVELRVLSLLQSSRRLQLKVLLKILAFLLTSRVFNGLSSSMAL
jgi:hypothetical protein